jgi:AcrR family transcriptional regulator
MNEATLERRSPSQTRSRERREKILLAADQLAKKSWSIDGITSREIAEVAGVPIGSVYYIFPNVQVIFYTLLSQYLLDAQSSTQATVAPNLDNWEQLQNKAIDDLMRFFLAAPVISTLWRGLRNDPILEQLNRSDNLSWENDNVSFLKVLFPARNEKHIRTVAKVMVTISESLLVDVLESKNASARKVVIEELKFNLKAYIHAHLAEEKRKPSIKRAK